MALAEYLPEKNLFLNCSAEDALAAVLQAAEALCRLSYAKSAWIPYVLERQRQLSVCLGRGLAVAHGLLEGEGHILGTGLVLLQYPNGVRFEEERVFIVIGLAALREKHMTLLSEIGAAFSADHRLAYRLAGAKTKEEIRAYLEAI